MKSVCYVDNVLEEVKSGVRKARVLFLREDVADDKANIARILEREKRKAPYSMERFLWILDEYHSISSHDNYGEIISVEESVKRGDILWDII